jgi:molybdenum cofactor synthesis domain-containing protein
MIRVAILTVSDSVAAGTRADESGPALRRRCEELNWPVIKAAVVPDDEAKIAAQLEEWADKEDISLILTTGGTGVALRDVTPEATRGILHREIPGIAELMRAKGMEQTKYSVLSRSVTGTRNRSLIVNLPGSPRGALHGLQVTEPLISHIIDLLQGKTQH